MNPFLAFLHTAAAHVETFGALAAELAPDIPVRHVVDEELLRDAVSGGLTPALRRRVATVVADLATEDARVVVCTCSTLGACAEAAAGGVPGVVMRIDRPMVERAVAIGRRVVVVAALDSTLAPTTELVREVAREANIPVTIETLLCDTAWRHFEAGDRQRFEEEIATRLQAEAALLGDVVVLAQASMAGVVERTESLAIPVLASPRSGVDAAARAFRRYLDTAGL